MPSRLLGRGYVKSGKVHINPLAPLRCCICGATEGLVEQKVDLGDGHFLSIIECCDRDACEARWDQKHAAPEKGMMLGERHKN